MNKKNTAIGAILIFIIFFSLFLLLHSRINGFFTIDDPYYHAKHAYLMAESGNYTLVKPWLEFHFFKYAPVDAWWGYHVILALFIKFFGILTGAKILASLLSALAFSTFYLILKSFKIRFAFLFAFLYYASSSFIQFRLLSERPYISAYTVLPLGFWLLYRKKFFWLFLLSLLYTLFYQLSPLIIILAGFYCMTEFYLDRRINLKPIIATGGGVLAGILVHPNSLNYLYVMYIHLFQVLYLKFTGTDLNVGIELNVGSLVGFINQNAIGLILYLLAVVVFFGLLKKTPLSDKKNIYFLFIYSISWYIFSLFVPRGIDYWYPFACLFIAFVFNYFIKTSEWKLITAFIKSKTNTKVLIFFIISASLSFVLYNSATLLEYISHRNGNTVDRGFKEANEWLIKNTKADSVIFYANWSIWPMMFFYNNHNHYIAGMDPTLLYEYDQKIYWLWKNIGWQGLYCAKEFCPEAVPSRNLLAVKHAFREVFGSDFIILNNDGKWRLEKILEADRNNYARVFVNKELVIYRVLW